jgi:hypothetical protein
MGDMENAQERHSEIRGMFELLKQWLASPFGLVVSFLAAVAMDDNPADASNTTNGK